MSDTNTIHWEFFIKGGCRGKRTEPRPRSMKNGNAVDVDLVRNVMDFEEMLIVLKQTRRGEIAVWFDNFCKENNITHKQYRNLLYRIKTGCYSHLKEKEFAG